MVALLAIEPASATSVTDCPLRDRVFSIDSPLIDVFSDQRATDAIRREAPGVIERLPGWMTSPATPSFGAIVSLRAAAAFLKISPDVLASIDKELAALPVTSDDKRARCARYDEDRPQLEIPPGRPRILLFEKITGFKDAPSVDAAHAAFLSMAKRKGWGIVATDKAGAFLPATLRQFDAVIWNNVSGDVLTLSERRSFQRWMAAGGAFIGVHGTAGDPVYFWDWYADTLIGARFVGHPSNPQFRETDVRVEAPAGPLAAGLPASWTMSDEWYSFKTSPREHGATIVATLAESYLSTKDDPNLRMGDHPIAWTRCVGKGRMFYTAIGHRPESYVQPQVQQLIENGITWAISAKACGAH